MKNFFSWGVDGFGVKHYDCRFCGEYFGSEIDPFDYEHECNLQKTVINENQLELFED